MGRLADIYGGKRLFVIGIGWLVIWSIIAGVSHNELLLVLSRAISGLGPAAFLPSSVMLLGSVYRPGPRKNLVSSPCEPTLFWSGPGCSFEPALDTAADPIHDKFELMRELRRFSHCTVHARLSASSSVYSSLASLHNCSAGDGTSSSVQGSPPRRFSWLGPACRAPVRRETSSRD